MILKTIENDDLSCNVLVTTLPPYLAVLPRDLGGEGWGQRIEMEDWVSAGAVECALGLAS
eukprot:2930074-Rhodomonas_salina.6